MSKKCFFEGNLKDWNLLCDLIITDISFFFSALCRNITDHLSRLSDVEKELQAAKSELEESRELHKTDMEAVLNSVREDLLNKYKLELEKVKSESEFIQFIYIWQETGDVVSRD